MTRPCSHCDTSNGHKPRSCSTGGGGLKLFGVRLTDGSFIHKSASMGNLSHYSAAADSVEGYLSDDNRRPLRKKGIPWTEEEHRQFLLGLHKLGRGNWRGISRNYVCSRTPTQVASHAQKYFIRQSNATGKKKRPSVFDLGPDMVSHSSKESDSSKPEQSTTLQSPADEEKLTLSSSQGADTNNALPCLDLSLKLDFPSLEDDEAQTSQHHHMVRPAMKELVGMSQLTL